MRVSFLSRVLLHFFLVAGISHLLSGKVPLAHADTATKKLPSGVVSKLLEFDEVVASSRQYHPLITAATQERAGADGERLSAQGAFDRVLKGDLNDYAIGGYSGTYYNLQAEQPFEFMGSKVVGGYRQGSGDFPVYDDYYNTNQDGEIRAGLEVPLLRGREIDKRRTVIRKATVQQDIASLSLDSRKIELTRAAGSAYWEWVAAKRKTVVFEQLLSVARERDKQLIVRADAGDIARFDQTDNARQVLQRESQLLSARRALQKSEFELTFFYRDSQGLPVEVTQYQPPPVTALVQPAGIESLYERISEAAQKRPELQRLEGLIRQQQLEINLARNDLMPKLDLSSYLAKDMGAGSTNRQETELKVGVKLEVPLQTRDQEGRIQQYSAKERELKAQADAIRDRVGVDIRDAINAITISRERVDIARQELVLSRDLEQGERIKFVQGDSNLIFVNLREQTTADAAVREIDTVLEFQKAVVTYHAALGESEYRLK